MSWPDKLISMGCLVQSLALIPMVINMVPLPLYSTWLTAACLGSYVFAFSKLGQRSSAIMIGIMASLWWILFFQGVFRVDS